MFIEDLITYRQSNQQLSGTKLNTPGELVKCMGAMQSQDYGMSKWAIGIRLPGSIDQDIEDTINKGEIIHIHILRPTWHLVFQEDVRWMLELSAEQIKKAMRPMNKQLELTDKEFTKSNKIILKALQLNEQMTRGELIKELNEAGIETNSLRGAHLMLNAELDQIVLQWRQSS
jgi:hypothetical protein